jgi:hypothetical protein
MEMNLIQNTDSDEFISQFLYDGSSQDFTNEKH